MKVDKFTEKAKEALSLAEDCAFEYNHNQLYSEHILLALLKQNEGIAPNLWKELGVNKENLCKQVERRLEWKPRVYGGGVGQLYISPEVKYIFRLAQEEADRLHDEYIGIEHLLLALSREHSSNIAKLLEENGITTESIYLALKKVRGTYRIKDADAESKYQILEKYTRDLTRLAKEKKLDPMIGREEEMKRTLQILSRRTKNNPVLIGEPGVGKTAIVEGIAQKIVEGDVPELLKKKRLLTLDLPALVAGTKFRGEFEDRLTCIVEEIDKSAGEIILFIDEVHNIVGAGAAEGALDASSILKPKLARGELQCIGATTLDDYRKYIEKDSALERRFQPVFIKEPSVEETIKILTGLRDNYESYHKLKIEDDAIQAAAKLSARYIQDRYLPDKAVDLLDEAAARLKLEIYSMPKELKDMEKKLEEYVKEGQAAVAAREYEKAAELRDKYSEMKNIYEQKKELWLSEKKLDEKVDAEDIAAVVSQWTGIPVQTLLKEEKERLLEMESNIEQRVVGQKKAIEAVANAIRRSRAGISEEKRPIGTFLFLGPTGVGKTALAKALAWFLFNDENALLRIDCSEYMEKHQVSRLIGAPPGYVGYEEGGQLTEKVRRRPYQVILFDEIEKAHPEVSNLLLQLLDEGRLTDSQGHTVDFRNTVIIMTSNIASEIWLQSNPEVIRREEILPHLLKHFRAEFINRIDEIIIFSRLSQEEIKEIVKLEVKYLQDRLMKNKKLRLNLDESALEFLAKVGWKEEFGARPLKRSLQQHLENKIATAILSGEIKEDAVIEVTFSKMKNELEFKEVKNIL